MKGATVLACAGALALMLAAVDVAATRQASDASEDFRAYREQVLADLARGERYSEIRPQDRATVTRSLQTMLTMVKNANGSVEQLNADEKVVFFNHQEAVRTILSGAEADSRMVCKRERRVGSQMVQSTCRTVAESRRQREDSRNRLSEFQQGGPKKATEL